MPEMTAEFSRWLADVKEAIAWVGGADWAKVRAAGLKAGSKEAMPDAEHLDQLIARAEALRARARRGELTDDEALRAAGVPVPPQEKEKTARKRWGRVQ